MIIPELLQKIQTQECSNEELNAYIKDTLKPLAGEKASQVLEVLLPELFQALAKNTSVDTLVFSDALISSKGAKIFADAIKVNKTLTSLNLENIRARDDGGTLILNAMKQNTSIRILNIGKNHLDVQSFQALIELLKSNTALTDLNYSDNDYLTFYGDKGATEGKMLAEALQQNKTLTSLTIKSISYSRAGSAIFAALRINVTLQHLYLQGHLLVDLEPETAYEALKHNNKLKTLALGLGNVDDNYYSTSFIKIETLNAIFRAIGEHQSITTLDLSSSNLRGDDITVLAEALTQNKSLTHLELRHNELNYNGVQQIATALEKNRTLRYLGFAKSEFRSLRFEIATAIAQLLKKNQTLQTLILDDNGFCSEGATWINAGLKHNRGLTELSFANNFICEAGIKSFLEALKKNRSLTRLNIATSNLYYDAVNDPNFDNYLKAINKILENNLVFKKECSEMRSKIAATFLVSLDKNGNVFQTNGSILFPAIVSLIFKYADCSPLPYLEDLENNSEAESSEKQNNSPEENAPKGFTPLLSQKREDEQQAERERLQAMYDAYPFDANTDTTPKDGPSPL